LLGLGEAIGIGGKPAGAIEGAEKEQLAFVSQLPSSLIEIHRHPAHRINR
jgi:hypothetical protein